MTQRYGVVVIGRNEGQRLVRCLEALTGAAIVYVDSGSTDGSVLESRRRGCQVVELDMSLPFTAARARNAGLERLLETCPDIDYVQFLDGDCQLVEGWENAALRALDADDDLAVVCGRRREVNRAASIYNLMCDIEWDTPIGRASACGGDAMYRVAAFQSVGGFDESFIAGEEPELCYRLRRAGWTIKRLDRDMTRHDADMHRFRQWWKRGQRCGYAYALGAWTHGFASDERYRVRECLRVVFWGGVIPLMAVALAFLNPGAGLAFLVLAYGWHGIKAYRASRRRHPEFSPRQLAVYAFFLVLQKFPELLGVLQCSWQHLRGQRMNIIEYK